MLFNSLPFFLFFFAVYFFYLLLQRSAAWQNRLLLLASYIFYAAWDWRFLSLIWISTIVDYICGLKIGSAETQQRRKKYLFISICVNLGILGFFKYFNFFAENLSGLFHPLGIGFSSFELNIILPVGISFYTFQTLSYTIDIYNGKIKPTGKFLDFALFVAFFPQLVAGPIERAKNLLPQIMRRRTLSWECFYQGWYLIFWGLFQKVFIADNLALYVDQVYASPANSGGPEILLATYCFAFQIYCDFAGYSNIARGLSKTLGFDIMVNFNLPYFAKNPREFWQRWHISLSSWLRDYLYIPLGGNRRGGLRTFINLTLTMLLGGLWHGASWTFIIWGAYHGVVLLLYKIFDSVFKPIPLKSSGWTWPLKVIGFFHIVSFGWLIFRAQSAKDLWILLNRLFHGWSLSEVSVLGGDLFHFMFFTWILILVQCLQYAKNDFWVVYKMNPLIRSVFYYVCILLIIIFGVTGAKEFIYFQF